MKSLCGPGGLELELELELSIEDTVPCSKFVWIGTLSVDTSAKPVNSSNLFFEAGLLLDMFDLGMMRSYGRSFALSSDVTVASLPS
jgi:hypothetical protein